ncbi:hypothetical protein F66182_8706 [Fusarium sp. NRRL 66182]|nr:hypothetical protein F66182_8706 [Fusarium sp. NRRL 66182]
MSATQLPDETIKLLLNKYDHERDKRLKREGVNQYIDARSSSIESLSHDPWVDYNDPRVKNPPLKDKDHIKFLIIGAGINGVVDAGRLIEAGFSKKDVVCVDVAGGFGGIWYSYGDEIRGQIERSVDYFGIQGQFCTKINSTIWDESKKCWVTAMTRTVGQSLAPETLTVTSEFIILAGGTFPFLKVPKLPGWDDFCSKKHAFHSARWDYSYTGGTQEKPDLVKLGGKRVAIVGTGATGIQIVPELAKWADHVYVVQRTPSYVGARDQTKIDPEEWTTVTSDKGWQEKRRVNFDAYVSNSQGYGPDVINDGWTNTPASSGFLGSKSKIVAQNEIKQHIREMYELDFPRTEMLRKRVDQIVQDKDTAERLKAWPNVTLVDTDGKGLDGLTENGISSNGIEYEIDALILATGFTMGMGMDPSEKIGATIKGRDGLDMKDYWHAPDSGTLLGVALPGFPNLFSYFGRGSGATWNYTSCLETQAALMVNIIKQAEKQQGPGQRVVIEASQEGEIKYGLEVAKRMYWYSVMPTCTPGYFNNEGAGAFEKQEPKTNEQLVNEGKKMPWGGGPIDYKERTEDYIRKGDLQGFILGLAHTASHELSTFDQPEASRSGSEAREQPKPLVPKFQLLAAGFSFFCAGVDGASLGPLLPYIIQSFTINAGEVAIIYACIFAGWLVAAATNVFLATKLSFSALLTLGATIQLLAQCLRPWASQPLFFVSFMVQALGMGYQDSHANAWAGGLPDAHRCLGFIHAMFALGCLVGPLTATAIATAAGSGHSQINGIEAWRMGYFQLIGIHALNLIGMLLAFGSPLKPWSTRESTTMQAPATATLDPEVSERRRNKEALREIGQLLRMKSFWLIGGFYLFNCGAWSAAGGWVVEYLVVHRHGDLSQVGYVPTGFWAGLFLGRLLLAEPTHRFGEQRSIMWLSFICLIFQLLFWLVPNLVAGAVAFSLMGFFFGPFFATGMSVASRMFPRKIQSTALATRAGVQVLQPVILGLIAGGGLGENERHLGLVAERQAL